MKRPLLACLAVLFLSSGEILAVLGTPAPAPPKMEFETGSVAEARALAEADPAVKAGRLRVEMMTWYTEKGALAFPGVEKMREARGPAAK